MYEYNYVSGMLEVLRMDKCSQYEIEYTLCIFRGINKALDHEIEYGDIDRRKEMTYIVDRYCREEVISGAFLKKKLDEYIQLANKRYGKSL